MFILRQILDPFKSLTKIPMNLLINRGKYLSIDLEKFVKI